MTNPCDVCGREDHMTAIAMKRMVMKWAGSEFGNPDAQMYRTDWIALCKKIKEVESE